MWWTILWLEQLIQMASSSGSDIAPVPSSWWENCLPAWEPRHSAADVRQYVSVARKLPFSQRQNSVEKACVKRTLLFTFIVMVEACNLDKSLSGRVVRLFKLVRSHAEWVTKVGSISMTLTTVAGLLTLSENSEQYENVRTALIPRKEQNLSNDEREGYERLSALERERKNVLRTFEVREAELLRQLKEVRRGKDEFNNGLKRLIPEWGEIQTARGTRLTMAERQALSERWEGSEDAKERFTIDGYLLSAQNNKVAREERRVYGRFRRFRSTDEVIGVVRGATELVGPVIDPGTGGGGPSLLDDIAP